MPKIGRNDPCPCGSGRKYKYCCGSPSAQAALKEANQELALPDLPGGLPMADLLPPDLAGDSYPAERLLSQMGQMERALTELTRRLDANDDEDDAADDELDVAQVLNELARELTGRLEAMDRKHLIGAPYVVAGTIDRARVRELERTSQSSEWIIEHTERFAENLTYGPEELW
jgi:hypothetical protein